jgi:hypothetical protein
MALGTLKVGRIVPILFGAFRGRFKLFRTACAPLKIDKNFKINHPSGYNKNFHFYFDLCFI